MNSNENHGINELREYRKNLIKYSRKLLQENPDNLNKEELKSVLSSIADAVKEIDTYLGENNKNKGSQEGNEIEPTKREQLFLDFIDWYQVVPTSSGRILHYVNKHYSQSQYQRVLCVGDGENCHLGRKLAEKGYTVISVDPVAKKEFTRKRLRIINSNFYSTSTSMIKWADLIVGSKIPECSEHLLRIRKPVVFSISNNAEDTGMTFKGKKINSSEQLAHEIESSLKVKKIKFRSNDKDDYIYENFIREARERELELFI